MVRKYGDQQIVVLVRSNSKHVFSGIGNTTLLKTSIIMTSPIIATGAQAYPMSGDPQLEDASPNSSRRSDAIKRDAAGARIIVVMVGTRCSSLGVPLEQRASSLA